MGELRPVAEPEWQTSVQSLPPSGLGGLRFGAGTALDTIVADFPWNSDDSLILKASARCL